ncbi:hypothetical protein BpHYR1_007364 [Brachionus plicatilis]|uniref:Uncharacterized protein n=1 Tax=Brachionus plicatilis TaxID=10195 RepID=A0A3M7PHU2_BRAPC|nr:hypothetical protein BpHYR1_007364 [Brachionus plicatilis]
MIIRGASTKGTKGYLYNYFLCRNDLAEYLIAWHSFDTLYSSLALYSILIKAQQFIFNTPLILVYISFNMANGFRLICQIQPINFCIDSELRNENYMSHQVEIPKI